MRAAPGQLEQVLVNLVVNARDATPRGGRITIATRNRTLAGAAADALPGLPPGEYTELSVSDTGSGIAPEVVDSELASERPLRQQVDLDSMDWLHFLVGLHAALQVDIPESDYGRLHTLDDLLDYLQDKLQGRTSA